MPTISPDGIVLPNTLVADSASVPPILYVFVGTTSKCALDVHAAAAFA